MRIQKFDASLTIDVGLARRTDYNPNLVAVGDPRQWGHYYVERRDIGFVAGIWANSTFESRPHRFSGHEFFIVAEGTVIIEEPDGTRVAIERGECAVIPNGLEHRWIQPRPAILYFAKYITREEVDEKSAPNRVIRIDTTVKMPPSTAPARELLISEGTPATAEHTFFRSPDGTMTVGMWTATPYWRRAIPYPRYEMMHFLSGGTSFPESGGEMNDVATGETAVVPHGFLAEWRNDTPVKKIACNFYGAA